MCEFSAGLVGVHAHGQGEGAREAAVAALAVEAAFAVLALLFLLAFAFDRDGVAVNRDLHILRAHTWQRGADTVLVVGLRYVEGRAPAVAFYPAGPAAHHAVHEVAAGPPVSERIPALQRERIKR